MTVYEFLKTATEDKMALEIGRIIIGLMCAVGAVDATDEEEVTDWMIKCTAVAMHRLASPIDIDFHNAPETMELLLQAYTFLKEAEAEEDEGT